MPENPKRLTNKYIAKFKILDAKMKPILKEFADKNVIETNTLSSKILIFEIE